MPSIDEMTKRGDEIAKSAVKLLKEYEKAKEREMLLRALLLMAVGVMALLLVVGVANLALLLAR
jgi:hypothetical protein